mgnify:CR=1 FL=1
MAGKAKSLEPVRCELNAEQIKLGIKRIQRTLDDLSAFEVAAISEKHPPELSALQKRIENALEKTFGTNSTQFNSYKSASSLDYYFFVIPDPTSFEEYKAEVASNKKYAVATLKEAIRALNEDLEELSDVAPTYASSDSSPTNEVFVVHGHDGQARESVARYLEKIGFKPIILHEKASSSMTIIEKIEAHSEVAFTVVLLTPDDVGGNDDSRLLPRARQNVILELGYFLAKLGRKKVCALKKGDVETPSDFDGIMYVPFDDGEAWKVTLAKEMRAAGLEIDFNKVVDA